ncbi:MAG: hypothetical protein Q8P69_00515 [bacterium]|nr:hypothetical protein [bacterium]
MINVESRIEHSNMFEVKLSDALSTSSLVRHLSDGETIKFIVTEESNIILGTGLHDGIANENGVDFSDVQIEGQFNIKSGRIVYGYPDVRERRGIIEEKIDKFLKSKGIKFN